MTWRTRWCTSIYKFFLPLWRNFIGLLVSHFEESTIYFSEKHLCHLGHYMVAVGREKVSFSCFRVDGIQNSPSWERHVTRFPFKMHFPPLSPRGHILKQEFGGRGHVKALTLHKAGGLGEKWSEAQGHHAKGLSRRQPQNWERCVFCFLK